MDVGGAPMCWGPGGRGWGPGVPLLMPGGCGVDDRGWGVPRGPPASWLQTVGVFASSPASKQMLVVRFSVVTA